MSSAYCTLFPTVAFRSIAILATSASLINVCTSVEHGIQDVVVRGSSVGPFHNLALSEKFLFWGTGTTSNFDNASIQRASLDGSGVQTIITSTPTLFAGGDLAIHRDMIYWVEQDMEFTTFRVFRKANDCGRCNYRLMRSQVDGSGSVDLNVPIYDMSYIAIEHAQVYVSFWPDHVESLKSARLGNMEAASVIPNPHNGYFTVYAGKIFWVDGEEPYANFTISSANLDGSDKKTIFRGAGSSADSDITVFDDKVYWMNSKYGKIQRASVDGSAVEDILDGGSCIRSGSRLAAGHGWLYWSCFSKIQRMAIPGYTTPSPCWNNGIGHGMASRAIQAKPKVTMEMAFTAAIALINMYAGKT